MDKDNDLSEDFDVTGGNIVPSVIDATGTIENENITEEKTNTEREQHLSRSTSRDGIPIDSDDSEVDLGELVKCDKLTTGACSKNDDTVSTGCLKRKNTSIDDCERFNENSEQPSVVETSQPGCSTSQFHKLKAKVKKRHYRKNSSEGEESSENPEGLNWPSTDSEGDNHVSSDDGESSDNSAEERMELSKWSTGKNVDIHNVLTKKQPKTKMFIVPEMINRQIGRSKFFERRFYGSLHVVQRLELLRKMQEHDGCVNALNFNRKGNLLASASDDLRVIIWDWATGKQKLAFEVGHKSNIFEVKWLPLDFENLIATCARDGQVRLLDILTKSHRKLGAHHGPARRLAVHHDDPFGILSVGDDAKVLSIDLRESKPTKLTTVKDDHADMHLYTIHINPRDSYEFCVGGRSQSIKIYDRRKISKPIQHLCPENLSESPFAHVTCAVYNFDGSEILASYNDDDIYLFDTKVPHPSGDYAHRYEGHRNNATVKSVNFFGPKSEFIVSGSDCGNIFFWEKNTEAIVQWFPGDEQGVVNRLEPHPSVPMLATCGLDHDVKIWIPSCEETPHMNNLEGCVKENFRNRAEDISREPDAFDGQMLMGFLQHIRQNEGFSSMFSSRPRYRLRPFDTENSDSSDTSSVHSDSTTDEQNEQPQCSPS